MGKALGKVNPERKRLRFSKEFKLEAVRLLELGQKSGTELALELGVARNQLYTGQGRGGGVRLKPNLHDPGIDHAALRSVVIELTPQALR